MSYSLFQTLVYAFGGIVMILACAVFVTSANQRRKLDKYRLVSISMITFVLFSILHLATKFGTVFESLRFLGDFKTDDYGTTKDGSSIFGRMVTLTKQEGHAYDVNVMIFAAMAILPLIAFAILTRKPRPGA